VTAPAKPRRRRTRTVIGVLAGVVAVAMLLVGVRALLSGPPEESHFAGDDTLPISFDYPRAWSESGTGTNTVVLSPHSAELYPLLTQAGEARNWPAVRDVVRNDPGGTVGLYAFLNETDYGSASTRELQSFLESVLPVVVSFNGPQSRASLGRFDATRLEGVLSDPAGAATRLRFECYLLRSRTEVPRTIHLIFFSAASSFDRHRATFDRIAKSVDLPT
jgi:hypothetical protein